jgi:hypothetical protein
VLVFSQMVRMLDIISGGALPPPPTYCLVTAALLPATVASGSMLSSWHLDWGV